MCLFLGDEGGLDDDAGNAVRVWKEIFISLGVYK